MPVNATDDKPSPATTGAGTDQPGTGDGAETGTETAVATEPEAEAAVATEPKTTADPETAAKPEGDAEAGEKAGGAVRRLVAKRPGWALTARALVVLALAAAVTTAALQWHRADRLDQRERTRQQVAARAGQFGQALLSYDHTRLDAARKRVLGMAATDFGKTYDVAFTGGLQDAITKLKADATATVRTVYVSAVDGSNAKAIVVMDSEVKSSAGTRRVLGSYLEMELVEQHGQWRVNAVNSIGAINESLTKNGGAPAPSTAAPTAAP
ncbi:hypothetical protein ACRYCC_04570 [Actinomadura scrupuli]|uniref:hypothetical protein n=1 Tax=Actinomadura scrupuli TaxID=559629 RepID=UPI003D99C6C1